LGLGEQGIF